MERIDEAALADVVLTTPGWVRVGLTAPSSWMRQEAARELVRAIVREMGREASHVNEQGRLPL